MANKPSRRLTAAQRRIMREYQRSTREGDRQFQASGQRREQRAEGQRQAGTRQTADWYRMYGITPDPIPQDPARQRASFTRARNAGGGWGNDPYMGHPLPETVRLVDGPTRKYTPSLHDGNPLLAHAQRATNAASKPADPQAMTIADMLGMIAQAQAAAGGGGGGAPMAPKLDIGALLKPYDDAKSAIKGNYDAAMLRNEGFKQERSAQATADARIAQLAQQELERQSAARAAAANAGLASAAEGIDLGSLGSSGGAVLQEQAAAQQAINSAAAGDKAYNADQAAMAARDAAMRQTMNNDAYVGGKSNLGTNLFAGNQQIALERAAREADLVQQQQQMDLENARYAHESAQQAQGMAGQQAADILAMLGEQEGGGRVYSDRDAVLRELAGYDKAHGGHGMADDLFRQAIFGATDAQAARGRLDELLAAQGASARDAEKQRAKQIADGLDPTVEVPHVPKYSLGWFDRMFDRYYKTDPNRIRPDMIPQVLQMLAIQRMGGL